MQTTRQGEDRQFQPATDIIETADAVVLKLDMPGVSRENVDLTVDKDMLTIVGKAQPEESGEAVYRETYVGDYRRQFTLTTDVDSARIAATMTHGVLTVRIPKAEQMKPRRIQIAAAE
jgi:HSP20 family molecular chaperone IbpA